MIPSAVENIREKGSEEVPYSNERSTQTQLMKMDLDSPQKLERLIVMIVE